MSLCDIRGSHGLLQASISTGAVLDAEYDGHGYQDIAAFDFREWESVYPGEEPDDLDILDIGFWTIAGDYVPPCEEWRADWRAEEAPE